MDLKNEIQPMISVIIPFFENLDWLTEATESVLHQTYQNYEIIVVNDGSTEDVTAFLDAFGARIRYIHKGNGGPASARNRGIAEATGDYIAFLDSDDLWDHRKLERQSRYMVENGYVWSNTSYSFFNDDDKRTCRTIHLAHFQGDVFLRLLISSPIATPCIMIKSDFLAEHPDIRFSEKMSYGEDTNMWLKMAYHRPLGAVPMVLCRIRIKGVNAILRVRAHLASRSQNYRFIKAEAAHDEKFRSIPKPVVFAYWLSHIGDRLISTLEKKEIIRETGAEYLSRIVFLPPYALFKFMLRIIDKFQK